MLLNYSENGASTAEVKRTMGNICLDPKPCDCINFWMEIGTLYTETPRAYEAAGSIATEQNNLGRPATVPGTYQKHSCALDEIISRKNALSETLQRSEHT